MSKPLNEFGGWLSIFKVIVVISLVVLSLLLITPLIALATMRFMKPPLGQQAILTILLGITLTSTLILIQSRILKHLKTPSRSSPVKIVRLIFIFWATRLIIMFIVFKLERLGLVNPHDHPTAIGDFIRECVIGLPVALAWTAYFARSERVKLFYGSNVFE